MIGVDVYAVDVAGARRERCRAFLDEVVRSSHLVVPLAVVDEFLRVVTHPSVMSDPMSIEQGRSFISELSRHPTCAWSPKVLGTRSSPSRLCAPPGLRETCATRGSRRFWPKRGYASSSTATRTSGGSLSYGSANRRVGWMPGDLEAVRSRLLPPGTGRR